MWFLWETTQLPLMIAMVATAQFSQKQEVLERTNLPTFLTLFKNVIFITTSVCTNITLVGNCSHIETLPHKNNVSKKEF
jgi:ascorbate-specific PTS system EIIC-type component UlaA